MSVHSIGGGTSYGTVGLLGGLERAVRSHVHPLRPFGTHIMPCSRYLLCGSILYRVWRNVRHDHVLAAQARLKNLLDWHMYTGALPSRARGTPLS